MSEQFEPGRRTEMQGRIEALIGTVNTSSLSDERKKKLVTQLTNFLEYTKWPKPGDNLDEMYRDIEDSIYQAIDSARREAEPKGTGLIGRIVSKLTGKES